MMETLILGGLALAIIWWFLQPNEALKKCGETIPGPKYYPLIGNMLNAPFTGQKTLSAHYAFAKQFNGIYRTWFGFYLLIALSNPEDVEAVIGGTDNIEKATPYKFLHSWLGTGLLTSAGNKWHKRRKAITPTFHFKILEQFVGLFDQKADQLVNNLENKSGKQDFDIYPYMKQFTLEIICETAMGLKCDKKNEGNSNYIKNTERMCEILSNRVEKPWLHIPIIYALSGSMYEEYKTIKMIEKFTNKVIKEKSEELSSKADQENQENDLGIKKKTAFLELLLKIREKSTDVISSNADISEEVNTFLFAGFDTSASGLSFPLFLLSKHPDIQDKIYEELKDQYDPGSAFTFDSLSKMKYLERVIKECLRLYPPIPYIGRTIKKETKLPSGYTLPPKALAFINIYAIHNDEKNFPNPHVFNPDNFLPEAIAKRHPFSFLPFSAGPRNCIGQKFVMLELKTVLAKIIWNYKILPAESDWELVIDTAMVMHSATGHKLRIEKRV